MTSFFINCTGSKDHLSFYEHISQNHTRDSFVQFGSEEISHTNEDAIGKYLSMNYCRKYKGCCS